MNGLPFNGYKSYLGAGLIGLAGILEALHVLDPATARVLRCFGESLLAIGVAHKVEKLRGEAK